MCGAKIYIVHDHIDLGNLSLISQLDKSFSKKFNKVRENSSIDNPTYYGNSIELCQQTYCDKT